MPHPRRPRIAIVATGLIIVVLSASISAFGSATPVPPPFSRAGRAMPPAVGPGPDPWARWERYERLIEGSIYTAAAIYTLLLEEDAQTTQHSSPAAPTADEAIPIHRRPTRWFY